MKRKTFPYLFSSRRCTRSRVQERVEIQPRIVEYQREEKQGERFFSQTYLSTTGPRPIGDVSLRVDGKKNKQGKRKITTIQISVESVIKDVFIFFRFIPKLPPPSLSLSLSLTLSALFSRFYESSPYGKVPRYFSRVYNFVISLSTSPYSALSPLFLSLSLLALANFSSLFLVFLLVLFFSCCSFAGRHTRSISCPAERLVLKKLLRRYSATEESRNLASKETWGEVSDHEQWSKRGCNFWENFE